MPNILPMSLAGLLAGSSITMESPVLFFPTLFFSFWLARSSDTPKLFLALWGGFYVAGSGLWLLPALSTFPMQIASVALLWFAGFAFYGIASLVLLRRYGWWLLPISFPLAEWIAGKMGMSLAPFGLSLLDTPLANLISLGSVHFASAGLILLIVLSLKLHWRGTMLGVALLMPMLWLGSPLPPQTLDLKVVGVSLGPDAHKKWQPQHATTYLSNLVERSHQIEDADLIVWPENAVTTTFDMQQAVQQIEAGETPLLFGMNRYNRPGSPELKNSAVLLANGKTQVSDKIHLAPIIEGGFGPIMPAPLISGERAALSLPDGRRFLVLICYEAAFSIPPEQLRGVSFVVVISAETGFWADRAANIMERHAQARSLETGLPVIRVSDAVH